MGPSSVFKTVGRLKNFCGLVRSRNSEKLFTPLVVNTPRIRSLHNIRPDEPFKILFFGRDEFSCLVLEELHKCRDVWQGIWIATTPNARIGRRGSILSVSPLGTLGKRLGIPVTYVPDRQEFKNWEPPSPFSITTTANPNYCIVTASFGRFIPSRLLHSFAPSRRLNVHPSLLPLYRGPAPIQNTLADGKEETGVCVIEMKQLREGADVGEVWGRQTTVVPPDVDFTSLRRCLGVEGGKLLVSVLRQMLDGTASAVPQSSFSSDVSHAPRITQDTATVDFNSWDSNKIIRMHRAISHQRQLTTHLPDSSRSTLQLHAPTILTLTNFNLRERLQTPGDATFDPPSGGLVVRCARDTFALIPQVKQQDRALINAYAWWNGNKWKDWVKDGVVHLDRVGSPKKS